MIKYHYFCISVPFDIQARSGLISVTKNMGEKTLEVYTVKVSFDENIVHSNFLMSYYHMSDLKMIRDDLVHYLYLLI